MSKMYLVCGAGGSGKTTFCSRYEKAGYLHFSPDDFYKKINGDESNRANRFEVWMELFKAIHEAEQTGRNCVVDTIALTTAHRSEFLDWFPDFDEHRLVYIDIDEKLRRENNRKRARIVPEHIMDQQLEEMVRVSNGEDPRWDSIAYWENVGNDFYLRWIWDKQYGTIGVYV